MLFTTLHRMLHKQKRSYVGDTIMLYIGFSEVIYAGFYAKILDWNFRLVDENSRIFVVVVVFVTKINLFSSTKIFVFVVVDEKNTDEYLMSYTTRVT